MSHSLTPKIYTPNLEPQTWSYKSTPTNVFVVLYRVGYYRIRNCVQQSNIASLSAIFTELMLHLTMTTAMVMMVTWPNQSINVKCKHFEHTLILKFLELQSEC